MHSIESFTATTEAAAEAVSAWRLGCVRYLNAEPFTYGLRAAGLEPRREMPRNLGLLAHGGEFDAALLSLADYLDQRDRFSPLGPFCIATRAAAQSVLLLSQRPIQALEGACIAVTSETSTSSRLLQVLLARKYGVRAGRTVTLGEAPGDAVLLIGDQALRWRQRGHRFPHVVDLGTEWHEWTGLPFVFALWVVRRELPAARQESLRVLLAESLVRGLVSIDRIASLRGDTGLGPHEVRSYLHGFEYVIGPQERAGMARFVSLLDRPHSGRARRS